MDHVRKNTQNTGRKQLSYRQTVVFCLGGLLAALVLLFFIDTYCVHRTECGKSALREAENTAVGVAVWTDGCFSGTDAEMPVWKQGMEAYVGSGQEILVLDDREQPLFSSDPALNKPYQEISEENLKAKSTILSKGGYFLTVGSAPLKFGIGGAWASAMYRRKRMFVPSRPAVLSC